MMALLRPKWIFLSAILTALCIWQFIDYRQKAEENGLIAKYFSAIASGNCEEIVNLHWLVLETANLELLPQLLTGCIQLKNARVSGNIAQAHEAYRLLPSRLPKFEWIENADESGISWLDAPSDADYLQLADFPDRDFELPSDIRVGEFGALELFLELLAKATSADDLYRKVGRDHLEEHATLYGVLPEVIEKVIPVLVENGFSESSAFYGAMRSRPLHDLGDFPRGSKDPMIRYLFDQVCTQRTSFHPSMANTLKRDSQSLVVQANAFPKLSTQRPQAWGDVGYAACLKAIGGREYVARCDYDIYKVDLYTNRSNSGFSGGTSNDRYKQSETWEIVSLRNRRVVAEHTFVATSPECPKSGSPNSIELNLEPAVDSDEANAWIKVSLASIGRAEAMIENVVADPLPGWRENVRHAYNNLYAKKLVLQQQLSELNGKLEYYRVHAYNQRVEFGEYMVDEKEEIDIEQTRLKVDELQQELSSINSRLQ